ncbi:MAG: M15 family metallopeptidase [Propionicimonas sp.]
MRSHPLRPFLIGLFCLMLAGFGVPAVALAEPGENPTAPAGEVPDPTPSPELPTPSASPTVPPSATPSPSTTPTSSPKPTPTPTPTPSPTPTPPPDCRGAKDTRKSSKAKRRPFTVCGIAVVSKKHRITSAYRPSLTTVRGIRLSGLSRARLAPEAARALEAMAAAARANGHVLVIRSAHRSYAHQRSLYRPGMKLTAPAGASEHQLGLAVDLAAYKHGRVIRGYGFGTSAAGKWVRRNAAKFGFILRYPSGKQKITGIPHEPWHYRWIGVEHARGMKPSQTLEQYLKVR